MAAKYLVLDTETAGDVRTSPTVYDVAWSITDSKGATYIERRYIISEVYGDSELMNTAYYAEKLPTEYAPLVAAGTLKVLPLQAIRLQLTLDMLEHRVSDIYAYNAGFDKKALDYTIRKLSDGYVKEFLPGVQWFCIWGYAQDVVAVSQKYVTWCINMGYISEKGTPLTSAEVMYRYITHNTSFVESHTALEDVRIESEIMRYVRKHHGCKKGTWASWSRWQKLQELKRQILAK